MRDARSQVPPLICRMEIVEEEAALCATMGPPGGSDGIQGCPPQSWTPTPEITLAARPTPGPPPRPSFKGSQQPVGYFPGGSDGKASSYNAGDLGSIPGSGRSSGEGHDNPLQCSCLDKPMDRGAWWAAVHGVAKGQTRLGD